MKLRNKETGATESLHYGPAQEAVKAGTHEFIDPKDADGTSDEAAQAIQAGAASGDQQAAGVTTPAPTGDGDEIDPDDYSKGELEEIAESEGLSTSGTKAEIAGRINDARAED